ncbi:unnamed protein product [Didymodactylos carnosus]|uniref:CCDC92/74 N-terminal domain-containing protein n=1 Tax=Didymodactylos carnosus TaxID=1234261 RepID=A0A814E534_9BILA|nr:unnamed protein product [Didymodactylos carnosus]CAF1323288.1 unnamed protein product [Didymodactylos carnosus]CAF3735986.1 unnamed protein product [Didymodactylos carnosus]CAF4133802.1 unnamed protein product [Didymodactylos carnosus]
MTDIISISSSTNNLAQRLQSAEKSITFIQREHASTLQALHEEISKLQNKCSDLTFQMAIGNGHIITNSAVETKFQARIERLENEILKYKDEIEILKKTLNEKEMTINSYETKLLLNDRQYASDIRLQQEKYRLLKIDLEKRATIIAELTTQIHREKQLQTKRLGQILLPNKPILLRSNNQQQESQDTSTKSDIDTTISKRRLSARSSSLTNRTTDSSSKGLFPSKRPPTPPQALNNEKRHSTASPVPVTVWIPKTTMENYLNNQTTTEPEKYTKRQRHLLINANTTSPLLDANFSIKTIPMRLNGPLPPIVTRKVPLKAWSNIQPEA